jgi:hypothetical protein
MARAFLDDYMRKSASGQEEYLAYIQKIFDTDVSYYGKSVTNQFIVDEQRKYVTRWPARSYGLKPETIRIDCDIAQSVCSVSGDLDYRHTNPANFQVTSGVWHYEFRVVFSRQGPKIVAENGHTVSRAN